MTQIRLLLIVVLSLLDHSIKVCDAQLTNPLSPGLRNSNGGTNGTPAPPGGNSPGMNSGKQLGLGNTGETGRGTPPPLGTIFGKVTDLGNIPLSGATITLKINGTVVATTMTGPNGKYNFTNLPPGTYKLEETNLFGYEDISPPVITVILDPGENDKNNDFVDKQSGSLTPPLTTDTGGRGGGQANGNNSNNPYGWQKQAETSDPPPGNRYGQGKKAQALGDTSGTLGTISGRVTDRSGNTLSGAMITLKDSTHEVKSFMMTGPRGEYEFTHNQPGDYTVEEVNPTGYLADVSPNVINVNLTPGENDKNNDFVDELTPSVTGDLPLPPRGETEEIPLPGGEQAIIDYVTAPPNKSP